MCRDSRYAKSLFVRYQLMHYLDGNIVTSDEILFFTCCIMLPAISNRRLIDIIVSTNMS